MNKYQKFINQIVKDDLKKEVYKELALSFVTHRRVIRLVKKKQPIEALRAYKNWNKKLAI